MPSRIILAQSESGYVEEFLLPPLVAARALDYDLPPLLSGEGEEPDLPEHRERSVSPEKLLEGKFIPKNLVPQVNAPHQKPPVVRGELIGGKAKEDYQVPGEWVQRKTEAHEKSVLIQGHKPSLMDMCIL